MNKPEAVKTFKRMMGHDFLTGKDNAKIRQAWNDFVDSLQKSGKITEHQAATWVNPVLKSKDR